MPEWVIALLFAGAVLAGNCVYGLYLTFAAVRMMPSTSTERWYKLLFGIQIATVMKIGEYCDRGLMEAIKVKFFILGGIFALIIITGLVERILHTEILDSTLDCIAVYMMSCFVPCLLPTPLRPS